MPQPPVRVKIPAQVRERIHEHAKILANAAADTMIAALEEKLSAELAAAMREAATTTQMPPLIEMGEGAPPAAMAAQR